MNRSEKYQQFVCGLIKPGEQILSDIKPWQINLWHLATGVSGEAGELLDAVKKVAIYQKQMDIENVIEEIGDILFYLHGIMAIINMTEEEIIEANMIKLRKRYPNGYSNSAAITRADKDVDEGELLTR